MYAVRYDVLCAVPENPPGSARAQDATAPAALAEADTNAIDHDAINIQTNQPSFTLEARAEVTVGNLGFKQLEAAISGRLAENVTARFAVSATIRQDTLFNVASANFINEQDNIGLHGKVLWQPSDTSAFDEQFFELFASCQAALA